MLRHHLRDAKVENLRDRRATYPLTEEHVLGLHVAVDDPLLVRRVKPGEHLRQGVEHLLER
jgi:hypothetical protein